jgi:hypothetical protein
MNLSRFFGPVPPAIAATLLFAACVDLTSPLQGRQDARAKDGPASADVATGGSGGSAGRDAAIGGSGGSAAADGAATGGIDGQATTGGTGGTAMGGAGGNVALDAVAVADGTSSEDGGMDVPFSADSNLPSDQGTGGTGGATTGGAGGTGTGGATAGGATTGGAGGTATGGAGGTVAVDAGTKADATSSGDGGIDVPFSADTSLPLDLGIGHFDVAETGGPDRAETGGPDVAETGSLDVAGTGGADGNERGETVTDGAPAPMIISIDFVGGGSTVDSGSTGTVAMAATESAGYKPATHWNSAANRTGTLTSLVLADSTTSSASVTWNSPIAGGETSATWSLHFTDAPGDVRMMNGYLDPRATASPATINVTGLASPMSSGYDVYVYCFGEMTWADSRTARYVIGSTTHTVVQAEPPPVTSFSGYTLAPEAGAGNYVVFKNVTGTSFTLTATPASSTSGAVRAPVNGIQIVYPAGS